MHEPVSSKTRFFGQTFVPRSNHKSKYVPFNRHLNVYDMWSPVFTQFLVIPMVQSLLQDFTENCTILQIGSATLVPVWHCLLQHI